MRTALLLSVALSVPLAYCVPLWATPLRITPLQPPQVQPLQERVSVEDVGEQEPGWLAAYDEFGRRHKFANNLLIASCKGVAADLVAQCVVSHVPVDAIDWQRTSLFFAFNFAYSGLFLYAYQVAIFRRIFGEDLERFAEQPWAAKAADPAGLRTLAQQVALDLSVILFVYLPGFHIFRAGILGDGAALTDEPALIAGLTSFAAHFATDAPEALRVWAPLDALCFSLPLHLRLPVRHVASFVWTTYYSVTRAHGG